MKKIKKEAKKIIEKVIPKVIPKEDNLFETTDKELVNKLVAKGFMVKDIKSPFGERTQKLYIFQESESKVKEALNG